MRHAIRGSRAFNAAIKRDCAWFQSNPAKTRLRRKVTGQELPPHLRGRGIVKVEIERAGPDRFVRTFFDHSGCPVAGGFDQYHDEVVPNAPGHTITAIAGGPAVVDRADVTLADREYFERNPESTEYERDALPVELEQAQVRLGYKPRSGWVRVRQLAPGVRVRDLLRASR
jgi:hypothetical protein